MISVQKTKELIGEPDLSDTAAEQIRSKFYMLADLLLDSWQTNKVKQETIKNKNENKQTQQVL